VNKPKSKKPFVFLEIASLPKTVIDGLYKYAPILMRKKRSAYTVDPGTTSVPVVNTALNALADKNIILIGVEREKRFDILIIPPKKYYTMAYSVVSGVMSPTIMYVVGDSVYAALALTNNGGLCDLVKVSESEVASIKNNIPEAERVFDNDWYRALEATRCAIYDSIDGVSVYRIPDYDDGFSFIPYGATEPFNSGYQPHGVTGLSCTRATRTETGVIREAVYLYGGVGMSSIITYGVFRYDTSLAPLQNIDSDVPVGVVTINAAFNYSIVLGTFITNTAASDINNSRPGLVQIFIENGGTIDLAEARETTATVFMRLNSNGGSERVNTGARPAWTCKRAATLTIAGGRIAHIFIPNAYRDVQPELLKSWSASAFTSSNATLFFTSGYVNGFVAVELVATYSSLPELGFPSILTNVTYTPDTEYYYAASPVTISTVPYTLSGGAENPITYTFTVTKNNVAVPAYTANGVLFASVTVFEAAHYSTLFIEGTSTPATLTYAGTGYIQDYVGPPSVSLYNLKTMFYYTESAVSPTFVAAGINQSTRVTVSSSFGGAFSAYASSVSLGAVNEVTIVLTLFAGLKTTDVPAQPVVMVDDVSEAALPHNRITLRSGLEWLGYSAYNVSGVFDISYNDGIMRCTVTIMKGSGKATLRFTHAAAVMIRQYSTRLTATQKTLPGIVNVLPGVIEADEQAIPGSRGDILKIQINAFKSEFSALYASDLDLALDERPDRTRSMAEFLVSKTDSITTTLATDTMLSVLSTMIANGIDDKLLILP
jgi:hypothetical protein